MAITILAFKRALSTDEVYTSMLQRLDSIESTINFTRISNEAKTLHASRKTPGLYKIALQPLALHKAGAEDLRVRARLTELRVSIFVEKSLLDETVKKLRKYLRSEYAEYISALASNQADRNALVDRALSRAIEVLALMDSTDELLSMLITDIDKAAFTLTNSVKLLSLLVERPNQIV